MTVVDTHHLYIEVDPAGPVAVLHLYGELDTYTVAILHARVEAAINRGVWSLVIDLSGVAFLNAEGVGELVRAKKRLNCGAGTLLLAEVPQQARRTLAIKGLAPLLPCFPTVDDATAFLETWPEASRVRG